MYYTSKVSSPLGNIMIACNDEAVIGVWIEGQKYSQQRLPADHIIQDHHPIILKTKKWLENYFAGKKPDLTELALAPIGSKFQQSVWQILMRIPYGKVITYKKIAQEIAKEKNISKMSAQAVGGAIGRNPISIIIPCHRVVGSNHNLIGYAGGLDKKRALLELEQVDLSKYK